MTSDADWVLYGPDPAQFDVTLLHNSHTYTLDRACGFGAPRLRVVELFIDGGGDLAMADHRGLAVLMESRRAGRTASPSTTRATMARREDGW